MKIEFIKEVNQNLLTTYFTQVDGRFVNNSLEFDEVKAKAIYNRIVANNGKLVTTEVLESVEIEVAK
jgi:hypothetical protein